MAKYKAFYRGFLKGQTTLYVTSDFGKRDLGDGIKNHYGIDIGVPTGTVLLAPLSGVIYAIKVQNNLAGLYVTIEHTTATKDKLYILMMHLHSVESTLSIGSTVQEGDKIGTTGGDPSDQPNAGCSTGAHLHLEIRKGANQSSNAVDPKRYFLVRENLVAKINGTAICTKESDFDVNNDYTFNGAVLQTITATKYSTETDITVASATEVKKETTKKTITTTSERLAPGIWQITKLLIDSSVKDKQIADSTLATQQGSLLNYFNKVCQKPLVEFCGDTFGNQYYWFVRKPPFDKVGIASMMDLTMLDLSDDEIINTNLAWSDNEVFSWYQFIPYSDFFGKIESTSITPAVFFPEYAAIWGSRPLSVQSNYFNWLGSGAYNNDEDTNNQNSGRIFRNAIKDLQFLIESNVYTPFTRKGTIVIDGDRRIKRGTLVRHTTGEIFYVDAVNNSYSVNLNTVERKTTLTVSRGMYYDYINEKTVDDEPISYFNLIDWGENFNLGDITVDNWREHLSQWKVNYNTFKFFLAKKQLMLNVVDK